MYQYDKGYLARTASQLGYVRDTFEKTYRLVSILDFIHQDSVLSEYLSLKGGTAINLTVFNLPRLSVDVDLDFSRKTDRDSMLKIRDVITDKIYKYMYALGYTLSDRSKKYHALDSFVFNYVNAGGVRDRKRSDGRCI